MNYKAFHLLCLQALTENNPYLFKDVQCSLINGKPRLKNISTAPEPTLRYYRSYNHMAWNEVNPHGMVIDRFVVAHEVESRYAQEDWDHFESKYGSVSLEPAPEIKKLMAHFSLAVQNLELMEKIQTMHKEKSITYNDFNFYGGSKYEFTFKTFHEIYHTLKKANIF